MRRGFGLCLGLLLVVVRPAPGAEPTTVLDTWDEAHLNGTRAGFVRTTVHVSTRGGRKTYRTSQELKLTVKRFEDTVQLRMETGTEEDEDGKVSQVSMTQEIGKQQQMVMTGTVEGKRLHVVVDEVRGADRTRKLDKTIPWNDDVIGLYRQQRLFRLRKARPGDTFTYKSYEPTISYVVNNQASVKDYEEVEVLKRKQRLLRVEVSPERLEVQGTAVQLPALVGWLDKDYEMVRSEVEVAGLGKLTLYRSTRESADRTSVAKVNVGLGQLVSLNRTLPQGYNTATVVYRITLKGDQSPTTAFAQDGRQTISNVRGPTFDLKVRALRNPPTLPKGGEVGDEYLKSCYFINSDDAKVKEFAAQAVGRETDPWQKALRIERWVRRNMRDTNFSEAFATADRVAQTLEGDCTEHAVLAAALCRAAGVPSRTAFGLVYIERPKLAMGFHMWTEVWARGQWLPIDATLGQGFVGATHLKIADHSWHDTQVLTPLLPVMRVVGKVSIDIVRVGEE